MHRHWSALVLGLTLGCFNPSSENDASESETGECAIGTELCPCTPGGSCDPGLECLSDLCVDPNNGDGDGDGDPTGDGDGDGDMTGDGDGEPTGDGDGDPTGDGDGEPGGLPNGMDCTSDAECSSGECYMVPFLGGWCGECNEDVDCGDGGCNIPNPNDSAPTSKCNMGELGGNCETTAACMDGLSCELVFSLLDVLVINSCSECETISDCDMGFLCAPVFSPADFAGVRACITPGSLSAGSYCELGVMGSFACETGTCAAVDVQGIAQIGACGECSTDADCMGSCVPGEYDFETGTLTGSTCI
jgi:hypothetical protein